MKPNLAGLHPETDAARAVDVTRAQSAEQFRRDYECLRRLFDHAGDAIFVHGLDGQFTDVNLAACEVLGYTREEFLRMCPWDFVVRDARETILSVWAEMQTGVPITVTDELRRKDGTSFPAEVRLVRYSAAGRDVIIAICRDITKRRQAEAATVKAEVAMLAERNRMAREIHDTLAQSFTGVIIQLEAAKGAMARSDLADLKDRIERASDLARSSLGEARRSVRALRPRPLRDETLCGALGNFLKTMTDGTELNAEFVVEGETRQIPPEWEEGLLRIAQEALTNTLKHAQARRFSAKFSFAAEEVTLQLVDDGRGFDPEAEHDGFGLLGMQERVAGMGGQFLVRSKPSQGTEIVITLKQSGAEKMNVRNEQA